MIFCNIEESKEEPLAFKGYFTDVISSNNKMPSKGIAFISFSSENIGYIMTYKKTGRVATQTDRISFRNPINLEGISVSKILDTLPVRIKAHFQKQSQSHITTLSKRVQEELLSYFQKFHTDIHDEIQTLLIRIQFSFPNYSRKAKEIITQEKDAVKLIFKMFDFEESDIPIWKSDDNSAPFLKGYNNLTIREDPMVNHDSNVFGDWEQVGRHIQGAVEFEKENQKITILNVNRQPLETTLGVDLLIYHHTYQSYIFIQYKRMIKEPNFYAYRPTDSSYLSEIERMNLFMKTINQNSKIQTLKNYRLNNEMFLFKLCPAQIENLKSNRMAGGMYIPLKLWNVLLNDESTNGPKGGKVITFANTHRYFNNSQFINLAQNGWIGSKIEDHNILTEIVKSSIDSKKSLILAEFESYK